MKSALSALLFSAAALATPAWAASDVVTVYSADGLHDGKGSWFEAQFDAFTKATGVKVRYVEGGSGGVVERVAKEKSNPQADVLVTLPPFIQRAEAQGLLQKFKPEAAAEAEGGGDSYSPLVFNYLSFIYDSAALKTPPATYEELLDPKFKGKIQYSTPGQAGDGTAVMLQVIHSFGGKDAGFEFLKKLQTNNVGPSASTGKLTALVNKGELYVANGDVQMNMSQMTDDPGGQQQRVAIARALAVRPRVLLLDEPLSALDAQIRRSMVEEISKLHRDLPDLTILYVTHDQSEALTLGDRIAIMRDGELSAIGRTGELYRRPPNRFAAEFLGRANLLPAVVEAGAPQNGFVSVRVGDARLIVASGGEPAGAERLLCVRPQNLTLQGDAERSNRVSAVLREVHWQGELTHLAADIGETIVRVVATRLPNPPSRGDRLDFFFAPGDANLIAENAGV